MVDFRQSHWLRGKISAKHCEDERRNGSFSVVVLWFCCHWERSKIILVEIFSDMCCLVDNASWNCQTNTLARSIYPRSALRSLDARRGKVGNFLLLCLVQVSCNSVQQEIMKLDPESNYYPFWIDHLVVKSSFKRGTEVFSFYIIGEMLRTNELLWIRLAFAYLFLVRDT